MSAAVYRNTPSLSVPLSQNTALVLEFNCLYTHDVKKKRKKWQDGFTHYHTFNKRVMVYDDSQHFIGDTHWTGHDAVQEGEELTLDKSGVIVQVGDSLGQTETDLSEIKKSRRQAPVVAAGPSLRAPPGRSTTAANDSSGHLRPPTQLKHRSLNALLGTPKGPLGKAQLPQKSPFEQRQAQQELENQEWEEGRPPKRSRVDAAISWDVMKTTKAPRSTEKSEAPLLVLDKNAAKQRKRSAAGAKQQQIAVRECIEISDEDDPGNGNEFLPGLSSDALAPAASPGRGRFTSAPAISVRSSSPEYHMQHQGQSAGRRSNERNSRVPNNTLSSKAANDMECSVKVHRPSSGAQSQETAESNARGDRPKPGDSMAHITGVSGSRVALNPGTTRFLSLATSAPKRGKLLCEEQLWKSSRRMPMETIDQSNTGTERLSPKKSIHMTLDERLARIESKNGSTSLMQLNTSKIISPDDNTQTIIDDTSNDENSNPVTARAEERRRETAATEVQLAGETREIARKPHATHTKKRSAHSKRVLVEEDCSLQAHCSNQVLAIPPHTVERTFGNVLSDSMPAQVDKSERIPAALVRNKPTTSPTKRSREATPSTCKSASSNEAIPEKPAAATKPSRQRKPAPTSVNLNITSNGTSTVLLSKPFQAPNTRPKAKTKTPEATQDLGPWSREAFDLFTWRPPNWDEEKWCVNSV